MVLSWMVGLLAMACGGLSAWAVALRVMAGERTRFVEREQSAAAALAETKAARDAAEADRDLLSAHADAMIERLDGDMRRRMVSAACLRLLGFAPESLIGRTPEAQFHSHDWSRLNMALRRLDRTGMVTLSLRGRRADGVLVWLETVAARRDDGFVLVSSDISERRRCEDRLAAAQLRLQSMALEDGLTGLGNRRRFDDAVQRELRRAQRLQERLGLVVMRVEGFPEYVEANGHVQGDVCLRQMARAVAGVLRRPGDLAARIGPLEFALLLPGTDAKGATFLAAQAKSAVAALAIGGRHGSVALSAGSVSVVPGAEPVAADLLAAARAECGDGAAPEPEPMLLGAVGAH